MSDTRGILVPGIDICGRWRTLKLPSEHYQSRFNRMETWIGRAMLPLGMLIGLALMPNLIGKDIDHPPGSRLCCRTQLEPCNSALEHSTFLRDWESPRLDCLLVSVTLGALVAGTFE